jgi:subtilase-type serine protease
MAVAAALLCLPSLASAQSSYQEPGKVGDVKSWHTDEFKKDWGLAAIGADHAYARGLSGKNVHVGVQDTGAPSWHTELEGLRLLAYGTEGCTSRERFMGPEACFYTDGSPKRIYTDAFTPAQWTYFRDQLAQGKMPQETFDKLKQLEGFAYETHGTHVAGTVGAHRNGSGMHGVAFGSQLYSVTTSSDVYRNAESAMSWPGAIYKSMSPDAQTLGSLSTQWKAGNVRVANNSWGPSTPIKTLADLDKSAANSDDKARANALVTAALDNDLVQVFAAGNANGSLASYYASIPRYVPSAEGNWLSVVNLTADNKTSATSNICGYSQDWCIAAPGTDIYSSIPAGKITGNVLRDAKGELAGLHVSDEEKKSGYGELSGTSMAAPHVSGGLALLMERFPYMTSPQVRDVLLTTATDLGARGVDDVYGWGLMDLKKAIDGPGLMRVDTDIVMNQQAGGAKVWQGEAWDDWRNDIRGPGKLSKSGTGWLRLSGKNSFAGLTVKQGVLELDGENSLTAAAVVQGGDLHLNGQLVDTALQVDGGRAWIQGEVRGGLTTVGAQATLSGTGTLGNTQVSGTLAPGVDAVGTLKVNGDYTQLAGSVYAVEVAGKDADRIQVSGKAKLEGGTVEAQAADALLGQRYRIVDAGSVSGQFADVRGVTGSPFLKLGLRYDAQSVDLLVQRGLALATVASTTNQISTANAADTMSDSSVMARALTRLSPLQVAKSLDVINAEAYASLHSSLLLQGQRVNESVAMRVRTQQSPFAQQADAEARNGVWVDTLSRGGHLNADGNAARATDHGSLLSAGYDRAFGQGWVLGVNGASGRGDQRIAERGVRSDIRSRYVGVYAGKQWGGFGLRAGVGVAQHDVETDRQFAMGASSERNHAKFREQGQQGYLEGGYRFAVSRHLSLEPYLQWSRVNTKHGAIEEAGGQSALDVVGSKSRVDFATAGLRFDAALGAVAGQDWLNLGGALAYRQARGDTASWASAAWDGGGDFAVTGAAIGQRATLLNLHLGARLSRNTQLELGYNGAFAPRDHEHALNARVLVKF